MSNPPSADSRGALFITGASSGIGRACALRLAAEGFQVFAGVRTARDADSLRAEAQGRLSPLLLDITHADQVATCATELRRELPEGRLAGLINNAGICVTGPLEYMPVDALREQLEVNVVAQMAVTQAMLPMLRAARGRIVNIGSTSGRIAGRYTGPYCASKFALEALTSTLRLELQPAGIAVSIIEPGVVSTPFWRKMRDSETKLAQSLPGAGAQQYGAALADRRDKILEWGSAGSPTDAVCVAVLRALTDSRPRLRYVVGRDARVRTALAALLPERLWYYLAASRSG